MVRFVLRVEVDTGEIVRLYTEEGLRAAAIASRLGCSPSIVYARLSDAGVPRSRRARLDREELVRLYVDEGWSTSRIGRELAVAPQTVARHLREAGIALRGQVESLQPRGRRPCPAALPFRAYLLGFAWGDLAVERAGPASRTISVRSSTTHREQMTLIDGLFAPYGPVRWAIGTESSCVRVSLDSSFAFLFDKHGPAVPTWIRSAETEAAFAAGYIDAEGSFGIYDGRARFKVDSYDAAVLAWLARWMTRSGIGCRHRLVAAVGSARPDVGVFNGDLWRINVNDSFGILRLAATLEPFLRHERRRARMSAAVSNIHERLRTRAFP